MTTSWSLTGTAIVQGIAEPSGAYWAAQMQAYGTPIAAGVQAGCGGARLGELPIFDLVEQAVAATGAIATSILFTHPYDTLDAAREAIDAGIRQLVLANGDLPPLDLFHLKRHAAAVGARLLGPGGAGLIVPGKLAWGAIATDCYAPGSIALLSRSSGLLDEVAAELTRAGWGQSLAVELGAGAALGSDLAAWLSHLAEDSNTAAIVLIEQHLTDTTAAALAARSCGKPLAAYVAGQTIAPRPLLQEAATELASQFVMPTPHTSTAKEKLAAYQKKRIPVAQRPDQLAEWLSKLLK